MDPELVNMYLQKYGLGPADAAATVPPPPAPPSAAFLARQKAYQEALAAKQAKEAEMQKPNQAFKDRQAKLGAEMMQYQLGLSPIAQRMKALREQRANTEALKQKAQPLIDENRGLPLIFPVGRELGAE